MWFTPTPDVILPGPFICLLPWASGPPRPPPLITSADYNPLIRAHWEPVEKVLCDICVRCYSFSDQYKIKDFSEGGGQNFWPPLAVFCFPWNIFLFKNVNDTIKIHQHSKVGGFTNLVTITEPKNNLFARKTNFNFLTLTLSHNSITASQPVAQLVWVCAQYIQFLITPLMACSYVKSFTCSYCTVKWPI